MSENFSNSNGFPIVEWIAPGNNKVPASENIQVEAGW